MTLLFLYFGSVALCIQKKTIIIIIIIISMKNHVDSVRFENGVSKSWVQH